MGRYGTGSIYHGCRVRPILINKTEFAYILRRYFYIAPKPSADRLNLLEMKTNPKSKMCAMLLAAPPNPRGVCDQRMRYT